LPGAPNTGITIELDDTNMNMKDDFDDDVIHSGESSPSKQSSLIKEGG
jgi:hypothetical protein